MATLTPRDTDFIDSAAKECRTTSAEAQGVGSTRWIHFDLFKVNERFVAWDPPRRWAFTILDANLPGLVSVVEQALNPRAAMALRWTLQERPPRH